MDDLIAGHAVWMRRKGLAANTIQKRRSRLRKVENRVGLCRASTEDIEAILDNLTGRDGSELGPKARYQWISDLSQFYRWAIDFGHLDHDPTVRVVRPKQRRGLPRPIATGDLAMALRLAEPMMRAWLALMAFGGLRCAEVATLSVDGVLWDDGLIRVVGKFGKVRMVPMHVEVERSLRAIPMPSRGAVFRRRTGDAFPPWSVSRDVSAYFDSLGIGATAHQLRHWCGSHLLRVTKDLRVVQEVLGHSSPSTTAIYSEWSKEEARRAIAALELDETNRDLFSDWAS